MTSLIIFLVFAFVVLVIPISLTWGLYRWIGKKYNPRTGLLVASIIPLTWFYSWYRANYPDDDFYKDEFKEVAQTEFPASGEMLYKTATYPDFQGDYASAAAIEVNSEDFEKLLNQIKQSERLKVQKEWIGSQYAYIQKKIHSRDYLYKASAREGAKYYFIGFCEDRKTIVIHKIKL